MTRRRLPDRRCAETFSFQVGGLTFTCTVGRFPDGRVGEVFLNNHKGGSGSDICARARIGQELENVPKAPSGRQAISRSKQGTSKLGGREATGVPKVSRHRLKKLNNLGKPERHAIARRLQQQGRGAIVCVLREMGHQVTATDLVDWGCPDSESRIDFLLERHAPAGVESIVTNPPFKNAPAFVEHALELVPHVVMLLRLGFLESESRRGILDAGHLARVLIFRNRLPMMHRDGWIGNRVSNPTAFAWFIWEREHSGPASFHRLSWAGP
jgi:hypothetical protein